MLLIVPNIFVFLLISGVLVCEASVFVKRFEMCDVNPNYALRINATIKTIHKKQYINALFILNRDLDDTMHSKASVKMIIGKETVHLLDINERKSCTAFHKYMGEFVYDLERSASVIPGACPIRKGKYEVHDAYLDFSKFATADNFPFGHLLFTIRSYDTSYKLLSCLVAEVEHGS